MPDLTQPADGVLSWSICDPDHKNPAPKTTNPTQNKNKSKKQTDKDGFTSPNVTKKLKISDHPNIRIEDPIQLNNKFNILATSGVEPPTSTQQSTPPTKIPPIMLKYETTYTTLIANLSRKYPDITFKLAGEFLKIFTTNPDDYRLIPNFLTEK
ncbi:hypothetical protein TNCT_200661 [Trichonephila clavata]|uniref:Uncharacterized protein n=1 Tax=Trichonephila clavata TaxID=2740835 RepID=A0A8X6KGD1_TRICU|nr:hypothetical protein TNCT_200661 [Trichonephila clavata]